MAIDRSPNTPSVEQLVCDLDAGAYDDQLPPMPAERDVAEPVRFADVQPFDVRAWAARKGVKLPSNS